MIRSDKDGGGDITVAGPATEQVCIRASKLPSEYHLNSARFVLPAGYSPVYHALMSTAMRIVLLEHNVTAKEIEVLEAPEFTTAGETVAVARYIAKKFSRNEVTIMLVVRWWHARRAHYLLRYFLKLQGLHTGIDYEIQVVKVPSLDVLGMLREPFAWIKNRWRAKFGFKFKSETY